MNNKRLKEAKQFKDNYIRDVVGVEPWEIPTYTPPLEHWPIHLRDLIDKVNIEPKNPLTIAERKKPITIARIISPDTSKDLLIRATMQRYGKKDGKYKNPDELKKTLLQIKGA